MNTQHRTQDLGSKILFPIIKPILTLFPEQILTHFSASWSHLESSFFQQPPPVPPSPLAKSLVPDVEYRNP